MLADTADATSGGSPGHSAEALRRLLPPSAKSCPARCCSGWSTRALSPRPVAGRPASPPATRAVSWEGRVIWTGEGELQDPRRSLHGPGLLHGGSRSRRVGADPTPSPARTTALTPDPGLLRVRRAAAGRRSRGHGQEHDRVDGGLQTPPGSAACCSTAPEACTLDFASIPFTGSGRGALARRSRPGESGSDLGTGRRRLSRMPNLVIRNSTLNRASSGRDYLLPRATELSEFVVFAGPGAGGVAKIIRIEQVEDSTAGTTEFCSDRQNSVSDSLRLVYVERLNLAVFSPGEAFGDSKRRVQGQFTHAGTEYRLWVTDPEYERGPSGKAGWGLFHRLNST